MECFLCLISAVLAVPCVAFLGVVTYLYYKHSKYDHLPGPKRDSFFSGHIPTVRTRRNRDKVIIHQIWADIASQYMPLYVFWFYHRPLVVISDAKLVKEVLVTRNLPKDPFGYSHFMHLFGERLLGGSLLSEIDETKWKRQRAHLNPAFHHSYLVKLMDNFNESCDLFVKKLETMADGKTEVSLAEELVRLALDVIGKVAFDLDVNSINAPDAPIPANTRLVLEGLVQSFRKPFMKYQPSTYKFQKECTEALRFLRGAAKGVIEGRIKKMNAGEADEHKDILSYILKIAQGDPNTTMDDLVDHFLTFIVGGQETTSNHVSFALLGILLHPEVERKAVEEVEEVIGARQYVTYEDLGKLKYLDQTLKEALRLHPPQPAIARITKEDTELGGFMIPANTSIMCDVHVQHHHPAYWDEPERYDPERFSEENKGKIEHYAYYPFSLGPHNCIGMNLVQFQTKVMMVRLLQTFKLELLPDQSLKAVEQMTIRPRDGVRCTLTLR